MRGSRHPGSLTCAVAVALLLGCAPPQPATRCADNAQCPDGFYCHEYAKVCLATADGGGGDASSPDGSFEDGAATDRPATDRPATDRPVTDVDNGAPVRSAPAPSGLFPGDTTYIQISLRTNEVATCRYATRPDTDYQAMTEQLQTTSGLFHYKDLNGFVPGNGYTYYVRCADEAGNANLDDLTISFTVGLDRDVDIFRSLGPGNSSPLASGVGNALYVTAGAAELTQPLPDRIGVGDMIQYDSDSDDEVDALVMITERINASNYLVASPIGLPATPSDGPTQRWAVFRAYTSIDGAIGLNENSGIDAALRDFDPYITPPNLPAHKFRWNIACYADSPVTGHVAIGGWTTDLQHKLRFFTPHRPEQVGLSQRHQGRWTDGAFTIVGSGDPDVIQLFNHAVHLEGLQIDVTDESTYNVGVSVLGLASGEQVEVSHSIIRGHNAGYVDEYIGAEIYASEPDSTLLMYNNIIYGFTGAAAVQCAICAFSSRVEAINNTLGSSDVGIDTMPSDNICSALAVNNLFYDCATPARGTFETGTDHNATDGLELGYTVIPRPLADRVNQQYRFVDKDNYDLHLTAEDGAARNAGVTPARAPFSDDIDGDPRGASWDIGADEYPE